MKLPTNHLRKASREWVESVRSEYELEPHEDMVLIAAAECLDRREMAREAIAKDGLVLTTQRGTKRAHPLLAVERNAALEFLRIAKQLGLSGDGRMRPPVPGMRSHKGPSYAS